MQRLLYVRDLVGRVDRVRIEFNGFAKGLERGCQAAAVHVRVGQALPHVVVVGVASDHAVEESDGLVAVAPVQVDDAQPQARPLAVLDLFVGLLFRGMSFRCTHKNNSQYCRGLQKICMHYTGLLFYVFQEHMLEKLNSRKS